VSKRKVSMVAVARRRMSVGAVTKKLGSNRGHPPLFRPLSGPPGCEQPRRRTTDGSSRYDPLSASCLRQPESAFGASNEH
jgi:hypothetical protein